MPKKKIADPVVAEAQRVAKAAAAKKKVAAPVLSVSVDGGAPVKIAVGETVKLTGPTAAEKAAAIKLKRQQERDAVAAERAKSPLAVYLATLGNPALRHSFSALAGLGALFLGIEDKWSPTEWQALTPERFATMLSELAEQRSPKTASSVSSAVRGIVRSCAATGLMPQATCDAICSTTRRAPAAAKPKKASKVSKADAKLMAPVAGGNSMVARLACGVTG